MRSKDKILTWTMLGFVIVYVAGYVCYRKFGPCSVVWGPRGSDFQTPTLLIWGESRGEILLFRLFTPCVRLEELYLRVKYGHAA